MAREIGTSSVLCLLVCQMKGHKRGDTARFYFMWGTEDWARESTGGVPREKKKIKMVSSADNRWLKWFFFFFQFWSDWLEEDRSREEPSRRAVINITVVLSQRLYCITHTHTHFLSACTRTHTLHFRLKIKAWKSRLSRRYGCGNVDRHSAWPGGFRVSNNL